MQKLEDLTEEVIVVAREAGRYIREERKNFLYDCVQTKRMHDYVSYVDKESEKMIVTRLSGLLPEAGFLTEEGSAQMHGESYCWVVDPLDGTTNFIHDVAPYCVSIALKKEEEVILGVVYEICRDECFWSWKGGAAFLNGNVIRVSGRNDPEESFLALGFPYETDRYRRLAVKLVDRCYGHMAGLRLLGAAAAELCYVAAGRFEARVEAYLGPWDIAAGSIILENAGGRLTDFDGKADFASGRQVLASNGFIHDYLLDLVEGELDN